MQTILPVFIFGLVAAGTAIGMMTAGYLFGPRRNTPVKQMPYESGMDPIHDARRRFDVRFYLVAIAFLIFDVELLFLYPWSVASSDPAGIDAAVSAGWVSCRSLVFGEAMLFIGLVALGLVYAWRRGVLQWR